MRLFTRLIMCAAAAILLSAVLFHAADAWLGEKTSIVGAGRQLVLEARRSEALHARREMIARSLEAKREIIDQLMAGRLRFRQAIEQFQKANELVKNVDPDVLAPYQTPAYPQGVARQVLIWACNSILSGPSDKAQRRLTDLECEYQTLFNGSKPDDADGLRPMDTIPTDHTAAKKISEPEA
jgi:hypothetical protein